MNEALATLRRPDTTDIEAIRSAIEAFGTSRLPLEEINELLASGLRGRLSPANGLGDDTDEPNAAAAPAGSSVAHHHFTLPAHLGQGQLRTVVRDGEPWFVAADVAAILEYNHTPSMVRGLDDDESAVHSMHISSSNGVEQLRDVTVINESGLFSLILNSRKPQAKPFKRWVTHEVLPSIARTGGFQDTEGAMGEHLRAATDGKVGVAPQAPSATPGLPADLQLLLALVLPMLAELAPHLQGWLAAWLDKRTRVLLPRTRPAYADLPFYDLLNGRCKLFGRTFVARELGVSLPQISQVLNFSGRYGDGSASPHTLSEKVLAAYGTATPMHMPAQAALL